MRQNIEKKVFEKNGDKKSHVPGRKFYGVPFPKIYLYSKRVSCPFDYKQGKPKVFKNIWQLRMHFMLHHSDDCHSQDCRNIIGNLVKCIRFERENVDYSELKQNLKNLGVLRWKIHLLRSVVKTNQWLSWNIAILRHFFYFVKSMLKNPFFILGLSKCMIWRKRSCEN